MKPVPIKDWGVLGTYKNKVRIKIQVAVNLANNMNVRARIAGTKALCWNEEKEWISHSKPFKLDEEPNRS